MGVIELSAASHRYMGLVKQLSCFVCGAEPPSIAHHIRDGVGMAQKASDWLVVPLCWEDHVGKHGIHGDKSAWRLRKLTELDGIADTIERIMRMLERLVR